MPEAEKDPSDPVPTDPLLHSCIDDRRPVASSRIGVEDLDLPKEALVELGVDVDGLKGQAALAQEARDLARQSKQRALIDAVEGEIAALVGMEKMKARGVRQPSILCF